MISAFGVDHAEPVAKGAAGTLDAAVKGKGKQVPPAGLTPVGPTTRQKLRADAGSIASQGGTPQ
jgi:hypothetical protein